MDYIHRFYRQGANDLLIAAVEKALNDMGYSICNEAYRIIDACDDWYRAKATDAHKRVTVNGAHYQLERMGFGRRAAADDANMCEVIEINAGGDNSGQFDFINEVLNGNNFQSQYRKQLELTSAEGTTACYVWIENATQYSDGSIKGGDIRLNYVEALGFVPLTVVNDEVIEAAFTGIDYSAERIEYPLVVCRKENNKYTYTVRVFDKHGKLIPDKSQYFILGDVKPFAVLKTAQVNTFENMHGFGFPKLYNAIPILKGLDAGFTALLGDLDSAEKITLINEMLCGFDDTGKPIPPNESMKRRFVLLGEKLPQDKDLVHEITPAIRVEDFKNAIEMLLNLVSQQFGYGTKRYSLNANNEVMTAHQYVGERQDMLQELNRQRVEAKKYIEDIIRAILWFSNNYHGTAWNINTEIQIEFDDSLVIDKQTELDSMREDVMAGLGGAYLRALYLKQKYNLDDAEAAKWAQMPDPDADFEKDD